MIENINFAESYSGDQKSGESDTAFIGRIFAGDIRSLAKTKYSKDPADLIECKNEVLSSMPAYKIEQLDFELIERSLLNLPVFDSFGAQFGRVESAKFEPRKKVDSGYISMVLNYTIKRNKLNLG